jgi:hypothetical protein
MNALIGSFLNSPKAITMSDKSIGPDSVRSLYNAPETHETPGTSADKNDGAPRLHSGSRSNTKSFWPDTSEKLHGSFQGELLYALDSRSAKKIYAVLKTAIENQDCESLAGLADELDKLPLSGEQKSLFSEAITMRWSGNGDTLLETASFIAGGHDRDRYLTTIEQITALKIEGVCQRLGTKER